jgi:hypothetical protein
VTQKNSNRSSQRLLVLGTVVILCVLLGGGIWLVRGSMDLFSHIMPTGSANIALSTSMEPFDISLKSKVYDNQKGELNQIVEWKLKVPRAYVDDVQGKNGSVRHLVSTGAQDGLKILLAVHVLADGQTLEPYTMMAADQKKFDDSTMVIKVYNTDADWWIAKNDLCVQEEHRDDAAKKVGGPDQFNATCFPTIKFCTIYTHLDGWLLTINASKQLYAQPEKVCSLAKKFVNQFTVKRDYFPIDVPTGYRTTSKQPKAVTP